MVGIKNEKVNRSGIYLDGDLVGSVNGLDVQLMEERLSMISCLSNWAGVGSFREMQAEGGAGRPTGENQETCENAEAEMTESSGRQQVGCYQATRRQGKYRS